MTEEERIAAEEAATQEKNDLIEKLALAEEAKANLVAEIQDERTKKSAAQTELAELKEKPNTATPETDPEKAVERVLTKMQEREAQANMETALNEFKQSTTEFSPETDAAGIVFRKFEKELSKFNLGGLKTEAQFKARFKEVYDFMNRETKTQTPATEYHTGTPLGGGSDPGADDKATLNGAEAKLIKELGMDQQRFLEIKAKRPHYVASLLAHRS